MITEMESRSTTDQVLTGGGALLDRAASTWMFDGADLIRLGYAVVDQSGEIGPAHPLRPLIRDAVAQWNENGQFHLSEAEPGHGQPDVVINLDHVRQAVDLSTSMTGSRDSARTAAALSQEIGHALEQALGLNDSEPQDQIAPHGSDYGGSANDGWAADIHAALSWPTHELEPQLLG